MVKKVPLPFWRRPAVKNARAIQEQTRTTSRAARIGRSILGFVALAVGAYFMFRHADYEITKKIK